MFRRFFFFIFPIILLSACSSKQEVHRAFYYWKSDVRMLQKDSLLLSDLHTQRLYLHAFDVVWEKTLKQALPVAQVQFQTAIPSFLEVVPVVYITSETMSNIPSKELPTLAKNINDLLQLRLTQKGISWKELQLDCDWTEGNQRVFFTLIQELKNRLGKDISISCTIRLHQVKYPEKTGIPPVDRGMLMYYNMGNLTEVGMRNSIYDPDIAARYVASVADYPLPLDVALPIFSWGVHRKNVNEISLINHLTLNDVRRSGLFREQATGLFMPMQGCFFRGDYFQESDELRVEEIDPELCKRAAEQVKPFLKTPEFTVALYHLDSVNTKRYGLSSFEAVYSVFD